MKTGFRHDDSAPYLPHHGSRQDVDVDRRRASSLPINVVVQDKKNANLLIVGNDMGVYVSIDAGKSWARLKANLPMSPCTI